MADDDEDAGESEEDGAGASQTPEAVAPEKTPPARGPRAPTRTRAREPAVLALPEPRAPPPRPAEDRESARPRLDVSALRGNSPTERLEEILDMLQVGGDKNKGVREFALKYWRATPAIQNPYALFEFLSRLPGLGGASVANMVVGYVYGGPTWQANPYASQAPQGYGAPPYGGNPYAPAPAAPPEPSRERSIEEETQDLVRGMIASANAAMRVRMMMQAIGPVFGGSGSQPAVEMVPRPRVDEHGQPILDTRGAPVVDWVPTSPRAAEMNDMMRRFDRGETIDPTKFASLMVDMFKTGVQSAAPAGPASGSPEALMQMQQQIHAANIETLKAQFASTERLFDVERQNFLRQVEQMSPEKQAEQLKKLKELGLSGTDNLPALQMQLKVHMWEVERAEAKEQAQASAQARALEAQRGRDEFRELVSLGRDSLEKVLAPVTTAVGDGLRQRIATGGGAPGAPPEAPPPAAAPASAPLNYATMTPEQRARARAKLAQIRVDVEQTEAALNAAESGQPASTSPPAEPPYGA